MDKNKFGDTTKNFNPLSYYRTKGKKTVQNEKVSKWTNYVPKYVEPTEKDFVKKGHAKVNELIQLIMQELQTKPFVEIESDDPKRQMKNIYKNAMRRGIHLKLSKCRGKVSTILVRLVKD